MPNVIFPGLDAKNQTFLSTIQSMTGIKITSKDSKIIARKEDVKSLVATVTILEMSETFYLSSKAERLKATEGMFDILKDSGIEIIDRSAAKAEVTRGFGYISKFLLVRLRLFFSSSQKLKHNIYRTLFYFFKFLKCKSVVVVKTDFANYGFISMIKNMHYISTFGIDRAKKMVLDTQILRGVVPFPLDWLAFAETFLVFSPQILAVPVTRFDRTLFFFRDKPLVPAWTATKSFESLLLSDINPHSELLPGTLNNYSSGKVLYLLKTTVSGVNKLYRFSINPLNFLNENNELDYFRILQLQSLLFVLFADFSSVAKSSETWTRNRLSFDAFDKIENLRTTFGTKDYHWGSIFSIYHKDFLIKTIRHHFKDSPNKFRDELEATLSGAYEKLLKGLRVDGETQPSQMMRQFRNLSHGTFLTRNQFRELFEIDPRFIAHGALPTILYFSVLCMLLEPERFIAWSAPK